MEPAPQPEATLDACAPITSAPLYILIVEDSETVAAVIERTIGRLREWFPDAVIQAVTSWADAIRYINADPAPDLTLLDLTLPDATMHESIARVKHLEERTAVVIITGQKRETVEERLIDSEVEILEKNPSLWAGDGIIRAMARAMLRRNRVASEARFSRIDDYLTRIKANLNASPE